MGCFIALSATNYEPRATKAQPYCGYDELLPSGTVSWRSQDRFLRPHRVLPLVLPRMVLPVAPVEFVAGLACLFGGYAERNATLNNNSRVGSAMVWERNGQPSLELGGNLMRVK
eukprot:gnl/Spiro4/10907_TR5807_c0_g7_i1.p1 gnl/Spiro4/10907_TR5807_c0_g7~~gnl/Spiro4/10907_TR5807_c0_g7_i1.p1  ORF type:complete len:132 (-),score=19.31 gnl/Spiro4/10907_TR5807_c0_g7_i1:26-367(-)